MTSFILIVAGAIVGILVPAGLGWDFSNFYDAGKRAASGQIDDIYRKGGLILGFYGTPLSAYFYAPLSFFPPEQALILFKVQNTVAILASLFLLYFHYGKFSEAFGTPHIQFTGLFLFLVLIYQPFWTIYRVGGQTTPTVFFLLILGLLAYRKSKLFWSALLLVLALMIKPGLLPILLFLLFVSGSAFFLNTLVISVLTAATSILLLGWTLHEEFINQMLSAFRGAHPWFYNSSLYLPLENLRALSPVKTSPDFMTFYHIALTSLKLFVLFTFVVLMRKSRFRTWPESESREFRFVMAILFCLLILQTVWEHYLSMLAFFTFFVVACRRNFSFAAKRLITIIFFLCLWQNVVLIDILQDKVQFESIPALLFTGFFKGGPLLLTLFFLWQHSRELFGCYLKISTIGKIDG